MLLVIVGFELLLGNDVVLWSQHVELRVLEHFVGIFCLSLSLLDSWLLESRLFEVHGLSVKLALQFSGLGVEPIVESQSLAEGAILPKT